MESASSSGRTPAVRRPISVGKCHSQTAKDRFGLEGQRAIRDRERVQLGNPVQGAESPFTWPGTVDNDNQAEESIYRKVPTMQTDRNCLTALSSFFNLYFVAYQGRIFVYRLRGGPRNSLPQQPDLQLKPPATHGAKVVGGYIDQIRPHSVNHLITGCLGDEEIVLAAYDDGDVVAYYTHAIANVVSQRPAETGWHSNLNKVEGCGSQSRSVRTLWPLLHENVGRSAWGLAIHQKSRLIAVSSNLREITIFAPATQTRLKSGSTVYESGKDAETRVRLRLRNWRIVILLGSQAHNIPNVCFLETHTGFAEKVCGVDIKGQTWIADIWKPNQPVHLIPALDYKDMRADGPLPSQTTGWGVLAFREEAFMKVKTVEDMIGVPAYKCPVYPPTANAHSPIARIERCLQDLPGNPCPPSKINRPPGVRLGGLANLNQWMLEGSVQIVINPNDNNLFDINVVNNAGGDDDMANDAPMETDDDEAEVEVEVEVIEEGDEGVEGGNGDDLGQDEQIVNVGSSDDDDDDGNSEQEAAQDDEEVIMAALTGPPFDFPAPAETPAPVETPALLPTDIQAPPSTVEVPTPMQVPTPVQPVAPGQVPVNAPTTAPAPIQTQIQAPTQPAPNGQNQAAIVAATLQTIETMQNDILLPFQSAFGTLGQALDELEQAFGQFENAFAQGLTAIAPLGASAQCHCPKCRNKLPSSSTQKTVDIKTMEKNVRLNMIYYPSRSEIRVAPWNPPMEMAFAKTARLQTTSKVATSADTAMLEDRLASGYYILRTYEKDFEMWRMAGERGDSGTKELAISCWNALTCQFAGGDMLTRRFFTRAKRLNMLTHIPELSLVVIGSPSGRVLLATLTRMVSPETDASGSWRWEHGMRAECVLPSVTDEAIHRKTVRPMHGVAVGRISDSVPGRKLGLRYRLMLHYVTHDILSYEISRDPQTGRICVS